MQPYIRYNQNTSKNILPNTELILCHIDDSYSSTAPIFNRETIKTEFTAQQDVQKYIGSKFSESLTLKFAFIKSDYSEFSLDDINTISNWLFGNGTEQKLEIFCDETVVSSYYYKGVFTGIERQRAIGTVALLCTFENNSSYLYSPETVITTTSESTGHSSVDLDVYCQLPVYPKITFTTTSSANGFNSVTITNNTNQSRIKLLKLLDGVEYCIDTQNAIISNSYGNCEFIDIGWNNISDISWIYLNPGMNIVHTIVQNGICNLKIEYENKILGGVLNEFSV
ncbi:MAG: phage tail family protein [Turicibacter sp.]|nr:phage tail family protein [Turicibacter sp.]